MTLTELKGNSIFAYDNQNIGNGKQSFNYFFGCHLHQLHIYKKIIGMKHVA